MFVLKTDNFWFVPWQYRSASEYIHSMFAACLLTVHTSEHHVLGCHVRLCCRICSIVCTGLKSSVYIHSLTTCTKHTAHYFRDNPRILYFLIKILQYHLLAQLSNSVTCSASLAFIRQYSFINSSKITGYSGEGALLPE